MWCGRKGIDCPNCGVFGECQRSACGLPNIETSTLGTSSSYSVNITEKSIDDIKQETLKEFAEKLKAKLFSVFGKTLCSDFDTEDITLFIDEVLAEYENEKC